MGSSDRSPVCAPVPSGAPPIPSFLLHLRFPLGLMGHFPLPNAAVPSRSHLFLAHITTCRPPFGSLMRSPPFRYSVRSLCWSAIHVEMSLTCINVEANIVLLSDVVMVQRGYHIPLDYVHIAFFPLISRSLPLLFTPYPLRFASLCVLYRSACLPALPDERADRTLRGLDDEGNCPFRRR